jgi:alkanesulfonate monooxygenase SsuD/methylene tetrahydromethanopterin reductase-like flavin-dependent oxidoreductase (luciferase family)
MARLDFGFSIPLSPRGGTVTEMLATNERLLAAAAEHGLSAWFVDHFQSDDRPLLECFAVLAHVAGRYPGLRVGTLVLGQSYRNPALVAKVAATLQVLTGGRFILGIGAGWKEDEYRAYGWPFPPARERIAQLDEAVRVIRALWTEAPASFAGAYYTLDNAYCEPRPDPPPPLMIGGGGERRTLRVVAAHADWWNADYYAPEDYARKLAALERHCRDLGRDFARITPTYYGGISVAADPARVLRRPPANFRPDMYVIGGTPDEVVARLERFAALGVAQVQLNFLDYPATDGLELFLAKVLPRFRA